MKRNTSVDVDDSTNTTRSNSSAAKNPSVTVMTAAPKTNSAANALLKDDEAERLQTKRAYNRECASRARKRGKDLVVHLEKTVKDLHEDKNELRRTVSALEKQIEQLQKENDSLQLGQQQMLSSYERMLTASKSIRTGATALPMIQDLVRSSNNINSMPSTSQLSLNARPFMGYNHFY